MKKTIILIPLLFLSVCNISNAQNSSTPSGQWTACATCPIPDDIAITVIKKAQTELPSLSQFTFSQLWDKYQEGSLLIEYQGRGYFKVWAGGGSAIIALVDI